MNNQIIINHMVKFLFSLQLNTKMYHWLTTSYARHKASDDLGSSVAEIMDKFVEVFIGKYNIKPNSTTFSVSVDSKFSNDDGNEKLLREARDFVKEMYNSIPDTELKNILDELLAALDKTLYLYQLK
jgi:DNA-binding ferritin-like protein